MSEWVGAGKETVRQLQVSEGHGDDSQDSDFEVPAPVRYEHR